jgi:multiple sugar transport system substrate-binding protein
MKRLVFLAVLLVTLMACLMVSGCKQGKKDNKITIEVWDFPRPKDTTAIWQQKVFAEFEKKHPNVKIDYSMLSWARGGQKLDVAVASATYPDICGSAMKPSYVLQDVLEPLDSYITPEEKADINPQALKVCQFENKTYAFPWYSTVYLTILNTDVFKERGVEVPKDGIWTWEEFVEKMKKLTFDRDGNGTIDCYGIGFGVQPGTGEPWGILYSDGGRFYNDDLTQCVVTSPEFASGVQKLHDLEFKYKVALPNAGGLNPSGDVWNSFLNKERPLASTFQGEWAIISLKKRNEKIANRDPEAVKGDWKPLNYMAAMTPIGKTGEIVTASPGVGNFVIFKQTDPVKRQLCVELAKELAWSDEAQRMNYNSGTIPVRKSIGNIYGDDPDFKTINKAFDHVIMPPFHPEGSKMDELIQRQIQEAMVNQKTIPAALKQAKDSVDSVLTQYKVEREAQTQYTGPRFTPRQTMMVISICILAIMFLVCLVMILRQPQPMKVLKKHYWSYLFIAPSLMVFTVFLLMPVVYSLLLAFQKFSVQGSSFIGLANFKKVASDGVFFDYAIPNTLFYTLIMVPEGILVSLILASIIAPLSNRSQTFFRSAYYLPGVISGIIIAMVWKWIFDPSFGLFNQLLNAFVNKIRPYPYLYGPFSGFLAVLPYIVSIAAAIGVWFLLMNFFREILTKYKPLPRMNDYLLFLSVPALIVLWVAIKGVYFPLSHSLIPMCSQIGGGKVGWLTDPNIALVSIMLSGMLMAPGGGVILYLAAMGRVPKELHECAMLDGAGPIRRWWHITVPLIRPTTLYLLVMGTIGSFQIFEKILIMTNGGPGYATTPLVMSIYRRGFEFFEFGVASAQALVLFAMVVIVSVLQFKFLKSDVEY